MSLIGKFKRADLEVSLVEIWHHNGRFRAGLVCGYKCDPDGTGLFCGAPGAMDARWFTSEAEALKQLRSNFLALPTFENRFGLEHNS